MTELKTIPIPELLLLQASGVKVTDAQAALKAAATIPAADAAKVQAGRPVAVGGGHPGGGDDLLHQDRPAGHRGDELRRADRHQQHQAAGRPGRLGSVTGTKVAKAAADSPKQWQHYFWIAVGGEVVFIPLIWLLAGFWSPKRARENEEEHERWLQAELAKLGKA